MHFSLAFDTFQSCLRKISVYLSYVSDMHLNYLHVENAPVQLELDESVICSVDFDKLTSLNWYLFA